MLHVTFCLIFVVDIRAQKGAPFVCSLWRFVVHTGVCLFGPAMGIWVVPPTCHAAVLLAPTLRIAKSTFVRSRILQVAYVNWAAWLALITLNPYGRHKLYWRQDWPCPTCISSTCQHVYEMEASLLPDPLAVLVDQTCLARDLEWILTYPASHTSVPNRF